MIDVLARLSAADLTDRIDRLGFRPDDAQDLRSVIRTVLDSPADLARIQVLVERLLPGIGDFRPEGGVPNPWDCDEARAEHLGAGVLPMIALLVAADEVRDFHHGRGVPDDLSWKALSDLGQQVWVHRQTYGSFGLHAHGWLRCAWSGALYWLGRLQFNLQQDDRPDGTGQPGSEGRWVLSSHIPQSGPLTPAAVDESFALASTFFAEHFADYPVREFHCLSWLLDPQLVSVLAPDSNMVLFQQRWSLYGEAILGDQDALFFTFRRRGDVDLDLLPQETSLQRAIVGRLKAGDHWNLWKGRTPIPDLGGGGEHS